LDGIDDTLSERHSTADYFETALLGCEIVAANGRIRSVRAVLEHFAHEDLRKLTRNRGADTLGIHLSLRAHALLQQAAGEAAKLETYLIDDRPPEQTENAERGTQQQFYRERFDRLKEGLSRKPPVTAALCRG
jgi:hypothetical protein